MSNAHLQKSLTPSLIWGLGVGYVISGMYCGWNLGLEKGGTYGMAAATIFVSIMYACISFSYTELACMIPKAGGAFDYANRAFGKKIGFLAGLAQIIEFVFAPPAIAISIGTYFNILFPQWEVQTISIVVFVLFTSLNIYGVKAAAVFELIITLIAITGILLFATYSFDKIEMRHLTTNALPNGWAGAFASIPFAIWFFLGIEGVSNIAEEAHNPQRDIIKGFGWAISTLIVLCAITFICSVGIGGWEKVVYKNDGSTSDSPFALAISHILSEQSFFYKLIVGISLFGLVASFHGLILASGRATYEFGKVGYAPHFLAKIYARFQTPAWALIVNSAIGITALLSGKSAEIITISVFGALTLYIISMLGLLRLRKSEPNLERPFKVPFYPFTPVLALLIGSVCMIALVFYNVTLAAIYVGIIIISYLIFLLSNKLKGEKN